MMIEFVRKNLSSLILKHSSPIVCRSRSPVSFSFSLSTSDESHTVFDILVRKYNFPPELASRVVSEAKDAKKADSILSFLKESEFSNIQLQKIVKYRPRYLSASLEATIKPKIKILQDEGLSSDDITKIIAKNPRFLQSSVENNIVPSLSVLKGLLGSTTEVAKIMRNSQRFLSVNFENTVLLNIEFLKSCGIPMERIRIILTSYPNCFAIKPEAFRKCADKANELGLDASSKSFIYAIATIAKMSNDTLEHKMQALRDLGFSDSDILTMFRKDPRVLHVSTEKINKIKEVLLATGKYNVSDMINFPKSFVSSVEERYIPRLRVLGILESRNLIEEWPSLGKICTLTDVKFADEFVRPYLDDVSVFKAQSILPEAKKGMKL